MSTSQNIAERMKAKGFASDEALARVVGCDRSIVTRIKLGKATPSLALAVRMGRALDLPAEAFLPAPATAEVPA